MAIIITDQYRLRQQNFLDDRQGLATTLEALRNWNTSTVPIPDGFEVYVSGVWYVYKSGNTIDSVLGKFRTREVDQGIDKIIEDIEELQQVDLQLEFDNTRDHASKFSDLLTSSFWTDGRGVNHCRPGRIVTVTSDGTNNGPWFLVNSNYNQASSWIKLVGRNDIITTSSSTQPSDTNIYSALKTDQLFPKKAGTETISGSWTFTDDAIFTKDIRSGTANIGELTVRGNETVNGTLTAGKIVTPEIEVSREANITGALSVAENTKLNTLEVENNTHLGNTYFGQTGSIITDGEGKVVATVDKIVAETSEIEDIDEIIEQYLGLIGVNNLLKNTGFTGQFSSKILEEGTNLYINSEVYSDKKEDWNTSRDITVVQDSGSLTGYSLYLPNDTSTIIQTTTSLTPEQDYIISWKQKGDVGISIDNYDLEIKNIDVPGLVEYNRFYARFKKIGNTPTTVTFSGGPGNICEIKLEDGVVPTSWFPSSQDTNPVAEELERFEYLREAFTEHKDESLVSGLFLKTVIKVGDIVDDTVEDIHGGISGTYTDPTDIMFWSGSDYESAQNLLSKVIKNPKYLNNIPYPELKKLTKAIITFGSISVFTDLYASGKFVGDFYDRETGSRLTPRHKISGVIPIHNTTCQFNNGALVGGVWRNIGFINPLNNTNCSLKFSNTGILTEYIVEDVQTEFENLPIYVDVPTGENELITLIFNEEGYLISATRGTTSFYWY